MKKLSLAFIAICASTTAALFSCSDSDNTVATITPVSDSTAVNVRYINTDSILVHYTLAQEITAELEKRRIEIEGQVRQRQAQIQQKGNAIQQKYQSNGYLTQASFDADQRELAALQNQAEQWAAGIQQQYASLEYTQTMRVQDSIKSVVKDICLAYGINAVINDQVTVYLDPKLDITDAVIEMLNSRYKPVEETPAVTGQAEKK